jgi:hypothetical protein
MTSSFHNPWVESMLGQMWIYSQATEVAARCVDTELLHDVEQLSDYCMEPSERRLNPMEFHGRRRCAPSQPAPRLKPAPYSALRRQ